jgi:predicted kinase
MSQPQNSACSLAGQPPLRCHLMIGAAASGKTTAARLLAAHLRNSDGQSPVYIASSEIRTELYGARGVIGSWDAIEARIAERLRAAVAAGQPVILEASYVKRAFRLAITQRLQLSVAVQWIGWWLDTPQAQCLQWNRQRAHRVPESVIRKHCAQLLQCGGAPRRCEGFAAVVRLESQYGGDLAERIGIELERLPQRNAAGLLRDRAHERHGYSRLLDLERLLHLLQLLSRHPKLTAMEQLDDPELRQLLALLHGSCYGDPLAVAVTARKDDAPAAGQAATNKVAGLGSISGGGGLIQTSSG